MSSKTISVFRNSHNLLILLPLLMLLIYPLNVGAGGDNEITPFTKQSADSLGRLLDCGKRNIDYVPVLQIADLLSSNDFMDRECATNILISGKGVDTSVALGILIDAIRHEINNPLSNAIVHPFSYPITQCLRIRYIETISALLENNLNKINTLTNSANGEFKTRLIIKMFDLGDSTSRVKAREILDTNSDGYLRLLAARTMNNKPDTLDIPFLIEHLNDDFHIVNRFGQSSYGIRRAIACALIKHGYTIDRIGPEYQENVITKEPNK